MSADNVLMPLVSLVREVPLLLLIVLTFVLLRSLGHHLIDYWFLRWEERQHERDRERWARRQGRGEREDCAFDGED